MSDEKKPAAVPAEKIVKTDKGAQVRQTKEDKEAYGRQTK